LNHRRGGDGRTASPLQGQGVLCAPAPRAARASPYVRTDPNTLDFLLYDSDGD